MTMEHEGQQYLIDMGRALGRAESIGDWIRESSRDCAAAAEWHAQQWMQFYLWYAASYAESYLIAREILAASQPIAQTAQLSPVAAVVMVCEECGRHGPEASNERLAVDEARHAGWRVADDHAVCLQCLRDARDSRDMLNRRLPVAAG